MDTFIEISPNTEIVLDTVRISFALNFISTNIRARSQDEMEDRPRVATFLNSIADYSTTIPSAQDADAKSVTANVGSSRMGTLVGVYLPCVQNIFGVILFIRLSWVVGTAGVIYGFGIVFTCCCVVSPTPVPSENADKRPMKKKITPKKSKILLRFSIEKSLEYGRTQVVRVPEYDFLDENS